MESGVFSFGSFSNMHVECALKKIGELSKEI